MRLRIIPQKPTLYNYRIEDELLQYTLIWKALDRRCPCSLMKAALQLLAPGWTPCWVMEYGTYGENDDDTRTFLPPSEERNVRFHNLGQNTSPRKM